MTKVQKRKSDILPAFYARDGPNHILLAREYSMHVADPASGGVLRQLPRPVRMRLSGGDAIRF